MSPDIPFNALERAVVADGLALDAALSDVLRSGWFILGRQVDAFEREWAAWNGASSAVGVASGTDAIEVALRALGIGAGDEVVVQANTCVPTVAAITRAGARPVLCDVERDSGTVDVSSMAGAIGHATRALLPVHLYGQIGDIDGVLALADQHGLVVIEDCAQAHGARSRDRLAGTIGDAGCFSFYPTKNLAAVGDAGALVLKSAEMDARARRIRVYGQAARDDHVMTGVNSRLDELQAAVLRVRLRRLTVGNARRQMIASVYRDALAGTAARPLVARPEGHHVYHLFVTVVDDRDRFRARMKARGIATLVHYPHAIHRQPAYLELADGPVALLGSEWLAKRIVSLPLFPEITNAEVAAVADAAHQAAG